MSVAQKTAATIQQPIKIRRKASVKFKPSTIAVYVSVFLLIVAVISIGYHQPQNISAVSNAADINSLTSASQTSVDNVVAATVAAGVAQTTNLPIATSVANLAVSAQSQSVFAESDNISSTKPQIIATAAVNRSVINYVVQDGDTIASLMVKFSVSAETIEWANNMTSDKLTVGSTLAILPVNGVLYTVKAGDTVDSIATKYVVDKTRLVLYNDLDVSGLTVGSKIILPNGTLPADEKPGYVAPVTYYAGLGTGFGGSTWYISTGTPDGPYAHGNCTLYAYNRRIQLGLPVGSNWGNAASWAYYARLDGLTVDNTPSVGAIMQNGGYLGHVAIVESIEADGDLSISEMNAYVSGGGYNIVSGRIIPAGNVSQYLYIH
jgi:surface antigen/LysM repeat protein